MIGKSRAFQLGGASVLTIMAASTLAPSLAHATCLALPSTVNGIDVVNIGCQAGAPPVSPFATSYSSSSIPISDGNGNDTLTITGGVIVDGAAGTPGVDIDTFDVLDASVGTVQMLGGNDTVNIQGGQLGTPEAPVTLSLGDGSDTFDMSGGTLNGSIFGGTGDEDIEVSGTAIITGVPGTSAAIETGPGNSEVRILGGTIGTDPSQLAIFLEGGANTFEMSGGAVNGNIVGQGGGNSYTISGGIVDGFLSAGSGNDTVIISGGTITGNASGEGGNDTITISGGSIAGDVEAETVTLTGGNIGGNIVGLSGNALVINDPASSSPLNLTNGVLFSGTNAVANVTDTDLAAGGSKTQVFSGFTSVTASNSTLAFSAAVIDIGSLALTNGSTLFVNGNVDPNFVSVVGSTITMIDGAADDVFTLGGLALNNATLGFDINQQTLQADRIVASTVTATGVNIINVNLVGTPVFNVPTNFPIIVTGNPVAGTFVITGVPGTTGSLFTYQAFAGPGGGLFIRAIPATVGLAAAAPNAIAVSTVDTAVDALYGISDDAIDADLGLANGVQRIEITPTFGVFASGQLAHTEHDGFSISANDVTVDGPSFDADDFSAAISLDFNIAKQFDFEDRYGLNLGLFGGYASTDVGMGAFRGFDLPGDADNQSGMFGGYGLFRSGFTYVLVAATTFIGQTDVFNGVLNTSGSYDTEGYAITGSVGHIFALDDDLRFDLRGGLLGVTFTGSDYVDSGGNQFGETEISFGAIKFEPGIYKDMKLDNGMVFSPYARADLQQRFGYENTSSIDGVEIDFDDADFSAALSTGFNLKMTRTATMSGEVRGKLSDDSTTLGAKLGLKVQF